MSRREALAIACMVAGAVALACGLATYAAGMWAQ